MRLVILLLLCPIFLFAQSGPGGVGSTDGTSNLIVWLKADDGPIVVHTDLNGSQVYTWSDHAGHQVVGLPMESYQRPSFKSNSLNAIYPTISFDGKDDFFQLMISDEDDDDDDDDDDNDDDDDDDEKFDPFSVKNNFTIFFVAKADVTHDIDPMSTMEDGSLHGLDYQKYVLAPSFKNGNKAGFGISLGTNGISAYEYGKNYFPAINTINNDPPGFYIGDDFHIFMIQVEDKKSVIYMDGQMVGEGLTSTIRDLFVPNEVGGGMTKALANTDNFFEGELAELIMFENSISQTENISIHNYLSAKYDIALAKQDVYKMDNPENGNYDHDVSGIGLTAINDGLLTSKGSGIVCISNPSDLDIGEYLFWGNTKVGFNTLAPAAPAGAETMLATTWAITAIGTVGTQDVCLNYGLFTEANPKDLRMVIDTNGDGSFLDEKIPVNLLENQVIIDTETEEITFKNQNLNDGDLFTFASKSNLTALPIALSSFRATVVENKYIDLHWTTESETNNQFFIIERSADSRTFASIDMVEGNGTTLLTNQYHLTDAQPFRGDNYYRIKQVDFDGTFSYSVIIKASIETEIADLHVFPNPTVDELTILLPEAAIGDVLIQVYNAQGQLVFSENQAQSNFSNIIIRPNLNSGIYFLRLRTKHFISSKSFVVNAGQ